MENTGKLNAFHIGTELTVRHGIKFLFRKLFRHIAAQVIVRDKEYILIGKHEASDEMAVAHNDEAYAFGFLAASITVLILLMLDRYFVEGGIPFYFAGYFVLGIGNLAAGWKFYKLERDGE